MDRTSRYNTEQRQLILRCFRSRRDNSMSIKDLLEMLDSEKIGRSTIYRQLEQLTQEGLLSRYMAEKDRCYVYRLSDVHCCEHYHLKCASCGKIVHLDCETTEIVRDKLTKNDFDSAEADTLILGKCTECKSHE